MARRLLPLLLLAAAFALRVHGLDRESFWWDEAYSALLAAGPPADILRGDNRATGSAEAENHPPAYYLALHFWGQAAGNGEFALRYLSVLAGMVLVAAGGYLCRRAAGPAGLIFGLGLLGAAPPLVYYAREARMFAPAAALAALSTALLLRPPGRWGWAAWAGLTVVGLFTFYYYIFALLGQAALVLTARRRPWGWLGAVGLALIPWASGLIPKVLGWGAPFALPPDPLLRLRWTWEFFWLGLGAAGAPREGFNPYLLLPGAALIPALVLGAARPAARPLLVMTAFNLIPPLVIALRAPAYHPRYVLTGMAFLAMLLAASLAGRLTFGVPAGLGLLALGVGAVWTQQTNPAFWRTDYRSVVARVSRAAGPGDLVLFNVPPPFRYYYRGAAPARHVPVTPYRPEAMLGFIRENLPRTGRVWYIWNPEVITDPDGLFDGLLESALSREAESWAGGLRLTVYRPGPAFDLEWQPADYRFGPDLWLTAYARLPRPADAPGLLLRWQAERSPSRPLSVRVALGRGAEEVWAVFDRPIRNGRFEPADRWEPGEVVEQHLPLRLPPGLPPGDYTAWVRVYAASGEILGLTAAGRPTGAVEAPLPVGRLENPVPTPPAGFNLLEPPVGGLAGYRLPPGPVTAGEPFEIELLWLAGPQPENLRLEVIGSGFANRIPLAGPGGDRPGFVRQRLKLTLPAAGEVRLRVDGRPLGAVAVRPAAGRRFEPPPVGVRVGARFGDGVTLVGATLSPDRPRPGAPLTVTLVWRADAPVGRNLKVFVHLAGPDGQPIAQDDAVPRHWTHPTDRWLVGEYVEDAHTLPVPAAPPPGPYRLLAGLYDPLTGARLPRPDGTDAAEIWAGTLP